ncbi:MAG: alternative ribosome rescue aminoacyl-tRNA hydrolase ArfB [Pseudohongiellaceae bacterium]
MKTKISGLKMSVKIQEAELEFSAIRASGPGGQHVNKVSSAVQLKFDIQASSLSLRVKTRLLALADRRISKEGIIVVKAQRFRSQDKNKQDAIVRLEALVSKAAAFEKRRIPTKPSRSAKEKRLKNKKRLSDKKSTRGAGNFDG